MAELAHTKIKLDIAPHTAEFLLAIASLRERHTKLAEDAHTKHDIPEANYQYGWVDALDAVKKWVTNDNH